MTLKSLNITTDVQLDELDRKLINHLQDGMPIASRPYEIVAAEFAISESELLERIQRLLENRILTRFGVGFSDATGGVLNKSAALLGVGEALKREIAGWFWAGQSGLWVFESFCCFESGV